MSPEQAAGQGDLDARSDITPWERWRIFCSPGSRRSRDVRRCKYSRRTCTSRRLSSPAIARTCRLNCRRLCFRCLAKSPADRFADVAELERVLGELTSTTPTTSYPDTPRTGERTVNESRQAAAEPSAPADGGREHRFFGAQCLRARPPLLSWAFGFKGSLTGCFHK